MINPKILILPDIHGRTFYKKALCEAVDKGAEIVCLGDYLDPYPGDELHEKGVFAPLKELVEVKKQHPGGVHLLIGNHDSSYMLNDSLLRVLAQIGMGRGGRYLDGSMIWADLDEYVSEKSFPWDYVIQIFGHSQQALHPVRIGDRAYCLDCRQPFYIDQEGFLRSYYWGDKPINAGDGISR